MSDWTWAPVVAASLSAGVTLWYTRIGWARSALAALHTAQITPRTAAVTAFLTAVDQAAKKPSAKRVDAVSTTYQGLVVLAQGTHQANKRMLETAHACLEVLKTARDTRGALAEVPAEAVMRRLKEEADRADDALFGWEVKDDGEMVEVQPTSDARHAYNFALDLHQAQHKSYRDGGHPFEVVTTDDQVEADTLTDHIGVEGLRVIDAIEPGHTLPAREAARQQYQEALGSLVAHRERFAPAAGIWLATPPQLPGKRPRYARARNQPRARIP
ncbi:hypothetical protein [Streptomyces sp. NPDC058412]|uniref:hypothetical protein n=1 Tax=Streptomyces sp. NPDC058412 TaxID=3346486 RepID=UPI0036667B7D